MKDFWNERYSDSAYVYGKQPNTFLKESLKLFSPGKILFPAEGEGRNAVYSAKQGWDVSAFDISEEGRKKAINLAKEQQVKITYEIKDFLEISYPTSYFDVIALIYAHFPDEIRLEYFRKFDKILKPDGVIIFEAFSESHLEYQKLNPSVGGPKDPKMLFSLQELKDYFPDYHFKQLEEQEVSLNEGKFHIGRGSVIRCIAHKSRAM